MSQVACIGCNLMVDLAKADVTGRGYRCNACTVKVAITAASSGRNDISDHLTADERAARHAAAGKELLGGVGLTAGGIVLTILTIGGWPGILLLCFGLGTMSHATLTRREMSGRKTE